MVVDALDVCSAETRTEICKTLRDIGDHVSLLLTCQNSGALSKLLPLQAVVEVSANDRDVARYVHSRIDQAYTLQELIFEDSELHGQICQAVIDKCQGLSVSQAACAELSPVCHVPLFMACAGDFLGCGPFRKVGIVANYPSDSS